MRRLSNAPVQKPPAENALKPTEKKSNWDLDGMNDEQVAEAKAIQERLGSRPARAKISIEQLGDSRALVVGEGSEANKTLHGMRVYEALGSRSNGFVDDTLRRLSASLPLTGDEKLDSQMVTSAIALISAVGPQDELETTMALQMVAANEAALVAFRRSGKTEYIEHATAYSNMGNKAMRSFALHAETLAKLRRGGEQVVRHVHVNEGGQAVIAGIVNTGGGSRT
jgi:hypothetical protein